MEQKKLATRSLFLTLIVPFFLFATAVISPADELKERIRQLEEVQKANAEELDRLKAQHIELTKEATAAAAALPTFDYRPRAGLTIMAADKSWTIRFMYQLHMHMQNHLEGEAQPGGKNAAQLSYTDHFTTGDIFTRRNQPAFNYCWNDCFYEIQFGLDVDGNEVVGTQRAQLITHFEQMNPWYPTFWVANPGGETHRYIARSSITSAHVENSQDLQSDSSAHNLSHRAIGFGWRNVALGAGEIYLAMEYATRPFSSAGNNQVLGGGASAVPSGSIENSDNDDAKSFFLKAGARPFSKLKNKWLQNTRFGFGWSVNSPSLSWGTTTRRIRVSSSDRVGRVHVMDIRNIGSGIHHRFEYGLEGGAGPYTFRTANGLSSFEDKARLGAGSHKGVHGNFWSISHQIFLWSPKGFLTGSPNAANSILLGWNYARGNASCGVAGCDNSGEFSRNHIIQRELDLWYFIRPGLSVGTWWNWWSAANVPTDSQEGIGCKKGGSEVAGQSCDWHTVNLGLRFSLQAARTGMEFAGDIAPGTLKEKE